MRSDGRLAEQLRPTRITPNYLIHAEGSVLVEAGKTKVICTASVEDRVPPFRRNTGKGWVTAEYGMLPRATTTRSQRESTAGKVGGRTQEIQRLIGRSLRAVTRLEEIGERTITLDCDVIQADGGTRTASITGAFVALVLAFSKMREQDVIRTMPVQDYVAATSVGIVEGEPMLDLRTSRIRSADVDMNIVKTGAGLYIELQGTAEALPFGREALNRLLDLGDTGIRQLIALQRGLVGQYRTSGQVLTRLLVATTNPGKMREIREMLADAPVTLLGLADLPPIAEPEETGATFEENARLKALYYAARWVDAGWDAIAVSRWRKTRGWSSTRSTASRACVRRGFCGPTPPIPSGSRRSTAALPTVPALHARRASSARLPSSATATSCTKPPERSRVRLPSARAAAEGLATTRFSTTRPTATLADVTQTTEGQRSHTAAWRSGSWRAGSPRPTAVACPVPREREDRSGPVQRRTENVSAFSVPLTQSLAAGGPGSTRVWRGRTLRPVGLTAREAGLSPTGLAGRLSA